MPIQRPLTPIQRPTLQVATAVVAGALVLGALYSLAQSFNISVPACGQPPMPTHEPLWPLGGPHHVGLLSFGTWSRIPVGGWAGGGCSSPLLVLLQHGSAPSPVQVAPQGGQDVLDSILPPSRPAGQWSR